MALLLVVAPTASSAHEATEQDQYVSKSEYEKLKREVEALRQQIQAIRSQRSAQAESRPQQPAGEAPRTAVPATPPEPSTAAALPSADREREAKEARRQLELFMREQKLLFKRGEMQFELSASYAQDTSERFFPPLGNDLNFALSKTRFRAADATLLARYGLADDLELNLDVPFLYVEQEARFFGGGGVDADDSGLGDMGVGLKYALLREEGLRPDVILSVAARAPTGNVDPVLALAGNMGAGTGTDIGPRVDSWSLGGALTLLKTVDPVVFFVQAGYTETFDDGDIDPGDQFPYAFGMGFSLNDRISLRGAVVGAYVDEIEIDGNSINDSDLEITGLQFAATGQLSKNLFIEPFVGFGLTEDATDFSVGLTVLYTLEGRYPLFGE
jgi:hypothetical protein